MKGFLSAKLFSAKLFHDKVLGEDRDRHYRWGVSGPLFGYSDTWQLVVNTGTTIITFLMVFLIQNTQNRETRIMRLKLDELLRGVQGARTGFVSLDKMTDKELDEIEKEFERLRVRYAPLIEDDLAAIRAERATRHSRARQGQGIASGPQARRWREPESTGPAGSHG
jgi:low affinity Fe/Cu permease